MKLAWTVEGKREKVAPRRWGCKAPIFEGHVDLGKILGITLSESEEQLVGYKIKLPDLIVLFTYHSSYSLRMDCNRQK